MAQTLMDSLRDDERRRRHMIRTQQHGRHENREYGTRRSKATGDAKRGLQRCHVVEGIVQLLANGFVLELLGVQFVWRSEVDREVGQVP